MGNKKHSKRLISVLMIVIILIIAADIPTNAVESDKDNLVIIGYKWVWKTKKVKVAKKEYMGEFWITHYCPCSQCCGVGGGKVTASGTTPTAGRTVGVNPQLLPYGTRLKVGSKKSPITYVAEDTGGGIRWKHLDVFCNSHQEALSAGCGYKKVWKITYKFKKKRYRVKVPMYKEVEG